MGCSFSIFMHYTWCAHVCADAFVKKILLKYPHNLDPKVMSKKKRGAPAKSKGGGALDRDG